jgi:hypothetical protein
MSLAPVHGAMTKAWALEVGFDEVAAAAIAKADVDVDRLHLAGYHMCRVPWGPDPRVTMAGEHLAAAIAAARQGDAVAAWEHLGRGLHGLQDIPAHGRLPIHLPWLDDLRRTLWGLPDPGQRRLKATERVTKDYLDKALADAGIQACMTGVVDGI